MKMGYSFIWNAGKSPYFILPNQKKVTLSVLEDIPYILSRDYPGLAAMPSEGGSTSSGTTPSSRAASNDAARTTDSASADIDIQEELLPDGTTDRVKQAVSLDHLMTHYPKNKWCPACVRAKMTEVHTPKIASDKRRKV